MKEWIPIIVVFLGASVGAYFAMIKTKREKIWMERFETLKEICKSSNLLIHNYECEHTEGMGIQVMSEDEKKALASDVLKARSELRNSMAKLQLLFDLEDAKNVENAYIDMNEAITDLFNAHPSEYAPDYFNRIAKKAEELLKEALVLGKGKYL